MIQLAKLKAIPFLHKAWAKYRLKRILDKHQQVADFWQPIIQAYFAGEIPIIRPKAKQDVPAKVIWQYWGQGIDQSAMPEVVKLCFATVDCWKEDYTVIRLSDETVKDYLDLPQEIWEKCSGDVFNKTFFSDLLRLGLLSTYGGIWLDATVLLTGPLPKQFIEQNYFMFQRKADEPDQILWSNSYAYYWGWDNGFKVRVLSSVIFANKESSVITALFDLMLHYWMTQKTIIDYFFLQILYQELISGKLASAVCLGQSDVLPHLLQTKINGQLEKMSWVDVFAKTNIHKLTYFDGNGLQKLKKVLKDN